jgi:hypothetical protein
MYHKFQSWGWAFLLVPQEEERMEELQGKAPVFLHFQQQQELLHIQLGCRHLHRPLEKKTLLPLSSVLSMSCKQNLIDHMVTVNL